jgi:hypothetical protein
MSGWRTERAWADKAGNTVTESSLRQEKTNASPYQMCVNNISSAISEGYTDAFDASYILGLAFCVSKEKVIEDILNVRTE